MENGNIVLDSNEISLNFERHDTYPDLPALKASAKNGCPFCNSLRATIRGKFGARFALMILTSKKIEGLSLSNALTIY